MSSSQTTLWDMTDVTPYLQSILPKAVTATFTHQVKAKVSTGLPASPLAAAPVLQSNLMNALQALTMIETPVDNNNNNSNKNNSNEDDDEEERDGGAPSKKRPKRMQRHIVDPCKIWVFREDDNDEIPETAGEKLSQLTTGGLLNGLAGAPVVSKSVPSAAYIQKHAEATKPLETAAKASLSFLFHLAVGLHRTIQARLSEDLLQTTPTRIHQMLAADLDVDQLRAIRKRIYDTVILGKGLHAAEDETSDIPTARPEAEVYYKCATCQNNDPAAFVMDRKNGDIICNSCGTVVSESIMHEGSQYRKFEGEEDRNHHGDAPNSLYSNAHNMSTSLSGVAPTTGAGVGWNGKRNLETILRNAHAYTEMNVSQFGKTDRRTRVGYKDRQKKEAFVQMTHVGDALNLHEAVVQRAKELFAGFRDDRELVQQFKGVIAACLCEAFEQLSSEGKLILKQQQRQLLELQAQQEAESSEAMNMSSRAVRRNELHHATLAGKGGLLLDFSNLPQDVDTNGPTVTGVSEKSAASWDLEDCRTWLLEASRTIAQKWVEERQKSQEAAKRLPTTPAAELEGKLVDHSIRLCEQLEQELESRRSAPSAKRVITPRVNDLTKLSIKWQHSHERGSGGKGGVGGSGNGAKQNDGGPTAGQILFLKTAKKLGAILDDPLAGEAFHKELRGVVARQEAIKLKAVREQASRQRLQQMKRKPWLQAKAMA